MNATAAATAAAAHDPDTATCVLHLTAAAHVIDCRPGSGHTLSSTHPPDARIITWPDNGIIRRGRKGQDVAKLLQLL